MSADLSTAARVAAAAVDRATLRADLAAIVRIPSVTGSEGLVAEARSGSFIGVQFHPEKSGAAGARFLDRCLSRG